MAIKTYILDTNIIMRNPEVLNGFADNEVVIPEIVLRELDHLKDAPGQKGYEARQAANALDVFYSRKDGNPKDGWTTEGGGLLRIEMNEGIEYIPEMWIDEIDKADNRIIGVAIMIAGMNGASKPTRLISGDKIMRHLAKNAVYMEGVTNLEVESYRNDEVKDFELSYKGWTTLSIEEPYDIANVIRKEGSRTCEDIPGINLEENEYVNIQSGNSAVLAQYREGVLHFVSCYNKGQIYGVVPKNDRQKFQMNACVASAEEIPCVIVKGAAGTGKTYIAEAAALDALFDDKYDKIIITRSMVNPDNEVEIGTLPGEISQKMDPYLKPFYDNLEQLMKNHGETDIEQIRMQIDDLLVQGKIEIQPMS
uniref:PhoH family protein n=1 Tax=Ruminococcus sp. TaxID=41978 RepID=UPI002589468C